jgi:hypothetical protein
VEKSSFDQKDARDQEPANHTRQDWPISRKPAGAFSWEPKLARTAIKDDRNATGYGLPSGVLKKRSANNESQCPQDSKNDRKQNFGALFH